MHKQILLGVNIDHIATIRQARGTRYPDPVQAALDSEQAGADGITVHLREDRRHIQERDIVLLNDILQTRMNLEMAATAAMVAIAVRIKPAYCCLVPEKRAELTTEGGLDVVSQFTAIKQVCETLLHAGIKVSLFIDPEISQIDAARECGVTTVELHTGNYTDATSEMQLEVELARITHAATYAAQHDMRVNAGHGLNYVNVAPIAAIPVINELNIGHAIIARALFSGLKQAVTDMKSLMYGARLLR